MIWTGLFVPFSLRESTGGLVSGYPGPAFLPGNQIPVPLQAAAGSEVCMTEGCVLAAAGT